MQTAHKLSLHMGTFPWGQLEDLINAAADCAWPTQFQHTDGSVTDYDPAGAQERLQQALQPFVPQSAKSPVVRRPGRPRKSPPNLHRLTMG